MIHMPTRAFVAARAILTFVVLAFGLATRGLSATNPLESVAYQINALHNGATSASLGLPLHVRWSVPIVGNISYPLIADGLVFTTFGTTLIAVNARNGHTVWAQTAEYGWIGAAFGGDRIYAVGISPQGAFMYSFDARTGSQIWTSSLEATGNYSFSSPPTTLNGTVYTEGAGGPGTLFAIRTSDGKLLWHATADDGDDTSPAVTNKDVFVAFACPQVYDFKPANGALLWHYDGGCHGGGGSVPVVDRGLVYAEDDMTGMHNGIVLNKDTGAVWGHFDSTYAMAFSQGIAFAVQFGNSNLTAMTSRNGKLLWSIPANTNDGFVVPPIVDSSIGMVFEGTEDGLLNAYKVNSGKLAMSFNLGSPVAFGTAMAIGDDMVVLEAGNQLVALSDH